MCLLGKQAIGLDIADRSIEVAQVKSIWGKLKLVSLGRVILAEGIVEGGRIKDQEKLAEAVGQVFKESKPRPISGRAIVFGLPERQVYLHHFHLAVHDRKDRGNLILKELVDNLPISERELVYSYRVQNDNQEGVDILAVGSRQEVINEWSAFFKKVNLKVDIFDTEALATFRDLFAELPVEPVLLIDIGSRTSLLTIFDKNGLGVEQVIMRAGDAITGAIAKAAEIEFSAAEAEKIKNGLNSRQKNVVAAIEGELNLITSAVKETVSYFETTSGKKIQSAILVGGSSQLMGLLEYFSQQLKVPTSIGVSQLNKEKTPLEYIEAIGLALRALDKNWGLKDPEIKINN